VINLHTRFINTYNDIFLVVFGLNLNLVMILHFLLFFTYFLGKENNSYSNKVESLKQSQESTSLS